MNFLDVNSINLRNAYPTALGNTVGMTGSSNNQTSVTPAGVSASNDGAAINDEVNRSLSIGGQSSAVIGALVFLAMLVGLMFLAKRVGGEAGSFSNIKMSAYNVVIIGLAAIVGIPVWKFVFTKLPLPGVSTWVHSV